MPTPPMSRDSVAGLPQASGKVSLHRAPVGDEESPDALGVGRPSGDVAVRKQDSGRRLDGLPECLNEAGVSDDRRDFASGAVDARLMSPWNGESRPGSACRPGRRAVAWSPCAPKARGDDLGQEFGHEVDRQGLHGVDAQELLALDFKGGCDEASDRDGQSAILCAGERQASLLAVHDPRWPGPSRSDAIGISRVPADGESVAGPRAAAGLEPHFVRQREDQTVRESTSPSRGTPGSA